jgi:hypothetical protein
MFLINELPERQVDDIRSSSAHIGEFRMAEIIAALIGAAGMVVATWLGVRRPERPREDDDDRLGGK